MAIYPEILFFDEPAAGLDPISARLLDDLILELRDSLGTSIVVVTRELSNIFAIGGNLPVVAAMGKALEGLGREIARGIQSVRANVAGSRQGG